MNPRILEAQYRDVVLIRNVWTKILKNATDSIIFNQILYWSTEGKNGKSKLRVHNEGSYWIAKTYQEWSDELYLPHGTIKDGMNRLRKIGLIKTDTFLFNGNRTTHIRINWEVYEKLLKEDFEQNFPEEFRDADQEEKAIEVPASAEKPKKHKSEAIQFTNEDFEKAVAAWNTNRKDLPEAQTLTDTRKRKIQKYFKTYGVEKTIELISKATKAVALNPWWNGQNKNNKKYNIDNLFNDDKVITYAESYDSNPPKSKLQEVKDSYTESQQLDY